MRRRDFLFAIGQTTLGCSLFPCAMLAQESRSGRPKIQIGELERLVSNAMRNANVPGVSLAIVENGQLTWRRGFGVKNNESKQPVDDETLFEAASVSKTVFAYAVMKLVEKGVIGLDVPLTRYTPERFLADDPRLELVTARRVLSHTAGFPDWRSRAAPLKISFTPGEKFLYSGEGYFYLQSVVTHLTGRVNPQAKANYEAGLEVFATDIDPWLKENLLTPFGMTSSGYVWSEAWEKQSAGPHDAQGKPLPKPKPTATDAARYASAGGLHTTPTEYARFLIEILNPKASDTFRLTRTSLQEMLRPQVKLDPTQKIDGASSWALGWAIQERETGNVIVHSGGQKGMNSLVMASVDRRSGFIILTNGDNGWKITNDREIAAVLDPLLAG